METRNLVLAIAGIVLIVACSVLAFGWKGVAEDAALRVEKCKESQRRRVLDIPRISIGSESIKYRGKSVVAFADLDAGTTITPLFSQLVRDRSSACDVVHVCLGNLVVLESIPFSTGPIVDRVIRTAWAAGYDIIQAPPRNDTW